MEWIGGAGGNSNVSDYDGSGEEWVHWKINIYEMNNWINSRLKIKFNFITLK